MPRPFLFRLFAAALLLSGFPLSGAPGDSTGGSNLARNTAAYSNLPELGPAVSVTDWSFTTGRMAFRGLGGTVTPLISQGRTLGFYFHGAGQMVHRSTDPSEWPAFASNYQQNLAGINTSTTLRTEPGQMAFTETVKSFFFWEQNSGVVVPLGTPTQTDTAAIAKDWAFFQRDGLGDRAQFFAQGLANTPAKTLVRSEITGAQAPYLYERDEGGSLAESLWSVAGPAKPATYDGLRRVLLSQQPLGWTWKEPLSPLVTLTHVDIDLRANLGLAALKVTETLALGDEGLTVIPLDLYNIVDPEARLGVYQVTRVVDEQGASLPFHHRHNRILVELPQAPRAGHPFKLTFEYGGRILLRPNGDTYWELGVEPWFPQPELGGQAYTVHAVFRTHSKDIAISCGKTLRRETSAEGNLLEVRVDHPIQFFSVMAGSYGFLEDTQDGLTIRIAAYGGNPGIAHKRLLNIARQTISFYEDLFEKFPFEEYNIVQVNDVGYGQAPPGMMKITNEAFDGKVDDFSALFTRGINHRFAHEIAHQYWGHLVKMPSFEEQWITESFSNYASALAIRSMKGKGPGAYDRMLKEWANQATPYAKESPIPFSNRLRWINNPRGAYFARTSLLYEKGGLILAALHKDMGDKGFAIFMKSLIANFRWKSLTTRSVEQVATMAGRKDYAPMFQDCYWGTQMPK